MRKLTDFTDVRLNLKVLKMNCNTVLKSANCPDGSNLIFSTQIDNMINTLNQLKKSYCKQEIK